MLCLLCKKTTKYVHIKNLVGLVFGIKLNLVVSDLEMDAYDLEGFSIFCIYRKYVFGVKQY